ncbi:putative het domain protein [Cladorrhinum samala]|uniref:Het domain protein n=1 Tax=Cladorrhinum samala TaxID=585594 RepID=A0AAV9HD77_9PEZI|nr:putative het domain protein [Cladorrhinum samala]
MNSVNLSHDIFLAGWTTAFCLLAAVVAFWLWLTSTSATPKFASLSPAKPTAYRYASLPEGHIRLLRLMPHPDERSRIECQLVDYPLLDSGKGTHLKGYIPVTPNLHMALTRLRDRSLERIIWADAICINQGDTEERNIQVQSMAKIYAKASRVIVWLEEATTGGAQGHGETTVTDSDRALEELRMAADRQPAKTALATSETDQQAILTLLQRSWFQRMWVLQEVAAARQVLIMCRSAEIDGYAFCSGLDVLNLASQDRDTQNRVRSAAYLMNGAIFRPKYATSRAGRFSLDIRPLGELLDMYHDRKATDPRDKIYALLGMSSDDHVSAALSPNYNVSWKDLFHQVVNSLVGEQVSVETWEEREIAVIKTNGWVLGWVSKVEDQKKWADEQNIVMVLNYKRGHPNRKIRWTLQTSAKPIREGDVLFLLQGVSKPIIIRIHDDYCAVIATSITPAVHTTQNEGPGISWLDLLPPATVLCDVLLVWDWEVEPHSKVKNDGQDYEYLMNRRALKHTTEETESHHPDYQATRFTNMALVMGVLRKYNEAERKLQKAMDAHGRTPHRELSHTLAVMDNLAAMCSDRDELDLARKLEVMADLLGRRGDYAQITEDGILQIATSFDEEVMSILLNWRGEEVQLSEKVVEAVAMYGRSGKKVMAVLLDKRGAEVKVTEEVVKAAAKNRDTGKEVMALLLDRRSGEVYLTEGVVTAAAGNEYSGKEVLALLLSQRDVTIKVTPKLVETLAESFDASAMDKLLRRCGNEVRITEEVVKAAAGNSDSGKEILALLLDQRGDEVRITEEVLKTVARDSRSGREIMALLLDQRGDEVKITEEVLRAVAENWESGPGMMALLLDQPGRSNEVKITQGVLKAVARNLTSGEELMALLLNKRGDEIRITREVIDIVAGNWYSCEGMMKLLVKHRPDEVRSLAREKRVR